MLIMVTVVNTTVLCTWNLLIGWILTVSTKKKKKKDDCEVVNTLIGSIVEINSQCICTSNTL